MVTALFLQVIFATCSDRVTWVIMNCAQQTGQCECPCHLCVSMREEAAHQRGVSGADAQVRRRNPTEGQTGQFAAFWFLAWTQTNWYTDWLPDQLMYLSWSTAEVHSLQCNSVNASWRLKLIKLLSLINTCESHDWGCARLMQAPPTCSLLLIMENITVHQSCFTGAAVCEKLMWRN